MISFFSIALAKSANQRFRSAREMLDALNSILPASDQTYYPFGFESSLNDSTGKFDKTDIGESEADTASPTVMIQAPSITTANAMEPPAQIQEIVNPILDAGSAGLGLADQQETEPVPAPKRELELQTSIDQGLQEAEKAEKTQEPVPASAYPSVPKTQMLEMPPFSPGIEEPSHQGEAAYKSVPPAIEPSLPADFIPASGNIFDLDEQEQEEVLATIAPAKPERASDTSPVNLAPAPEAKPPVPATPPKIEMPAPPPESAANLNAPTQMLQVPKLDQSSGNGKGQASVAEAAATVMGAYAPPEQPQASTLLVTPQKAPEPAPQHQQESYKATQIIHEMPPVPNPPSAKMTAPPPPAQQITEPIPAKPKPPEPVAPKAPPYTTVRPVEARPSGKPPAMQKYFYAAIALFIFIALVGGGILFFRKPSPEPTPVEPTKPTVAQPTQQPQPKPATTTPQPAQQPAATVGSVMVTSDPAGATVVIGDQERGVTPVEIPDLALGKYTVTLKLKGYQDTQKDVELTSETPNATIPITMEKAAATTGTLTVSSQPDGALIVIANKVVGNTPKTLYRKPGTYEITLKKDGYQDYTGSITVQLDKKVTFQGTLAEIPKPAPVVEAPKPKEPEVTRGQLVTLGPDVVAPKPKNKVYAKYPDTAKAKKLEGTVRVNLLVDETGRVIDIKVTKSAHPLLDDAVVKAYQQWTFEPATKQGVPVKVWISVAMSFQSGRS